MHIVIFRRNFTGALHKADFSALRLQPVADAVDSAELVLPADLPAQALDVQINHAAADRVFPAPDALIYRVAVERRAAVSHEEQHQIPLGLGKVDGLAASVHLHGAQVYL